MSIGPDQIRPLSAEEKRSLLGRLLLERAAEPIHFRLSFAQERLWFLDRLQPGLSVYNLATAMALGGGIDAGVVERCINEIVRRHEALRTTFRVVEGRPVQVVAPSVSVPLALVDLRQMPPSTRASEAERLAAREAQRPFDLEHGPLLRACLVCLDADTYVLLLTMHHIVSDAWSLGVLVRELSVLYEAYAAGRPSPLPALTMQYADYALWQRQWLRGEVLERHLSYWKRQLDGVPALLDLPADRARPAVQSYQGAWQSFRITTALCERLQGLSRQVGVTLYMVLLAAFQTLLHRYTGQTDMVVGTPIANRTRAEHEGLIGFFANTLVVRIDLGGDPRFVDLLARVREVTLEAYAHQDLPFEKLVEELQPVRHLSHHPLFQVMFAYQNVPTLQQQSALAAEASTPRVVLGTARFDLSLFMEERGGELWGTFEYNTDLFDHGRIERTIGHFRTLLEGVASTPESRLWDLPLLTTMERQRLLVDWNATAAEFARDQMLPQLFEAQVERQPAAVAVTWGEVQCSYGELNRRANQVAHYLRAMGVGPEIRVGLCVERSLEMVVGLLGILKAGGAYVPLDAAYPPERLNFMLADAQISVLVTQERLAVAFPVPGIRVLRLDTDGPDVERQSTHNPARRVLPDNLAYIIYTSGSTGTPKGAMGLHRGLSNLAEAQSRDFGVRPDSRVVQFASLSFDASMFEVVLALTAGATLCLGAQEQMISGRLLRDEAITVAALPTALLRTLSAKDFPTLQTVLSVGEACTADLVANWAPGRRFFNPYGPTEASCYVTIAECRDDRRKPSIGRAIVNTQIYLLDGRLRPVPIGVPGELCIGGESLARGYHARPDLTAEKFIPDALGTEPGARLYRTGDLARYLPDGTIEFLGRIDHQTKIRGFRVEPGEIETVLVQHPAVRESTVTVREDCLKDRRLVAYVVPEREQGITIIELRRFLKAKLPEHMIPSAFVLLEALPRLPNNKLNRSALPSPEAIRLELRERFVAPRTALERAVAAIWSSLLGVEHIGVHDNFFDLGGHSLLAAQLIARLADVFEVELPLRRLFEAPTIADVTVAIVERQVEQRNKEEVTRMLAELEQLTQDEAQSVLANVTAAANS
jgi:amino acid adenylation domain-containing protein